MLDFRQNSSRRKARDQQQRRRLLVLVLMLGIAVILIQRASDPALWQQFDILLSPPSAPADSGPIDNRLETVAGQPSAPNSFVVSKEGPAKERAKGGRRLSDVKPGDFEAVRDDAPSTRDERACSLRLLDILDRTDPQALSKASLGRVTYAQLFRQPDQYRGRLVTVLGVVRRAHRVELPKNEFGIREYYQTWLWPTDNPSAPMVVYCLRLPRGFPTGMGLAEQAEVTGFFFKRWAYQAQDALRTAPTLLAPTLQWHKRPVMGFEAPAEPWAIPLVACLAVLFALLAICYVYLWTRPTRPTLPDRPPDFGILRETEHPEEIADTYG